MSSISRPTPEEEPMIIEQGDEGEVLLLKIHQLKRELEGYDKIKNKLKSYEEQLKASDGAGLKQCTEKEEDDGGMALLQNANSQPSDGSTAPNDSKSNGLDAYELLEEKYRLSGSTSLAASVSNFGPGTANALISTPSGMTEEMHAMTESMTSLASPQTSRDDLPPSKDLAKFPLPRTSQDDSASYLTQNLKTSADNTKSNSESEEYGNGNGRIVSNSPGLLRGDRIREGSVPGAVSITGVESSSISRHVRQSESIDEETLSTQDQLRTNAMLIEAQVVDDENGITVSGPLLTAKRDPWYRRNQWWLAAGAIIVAGTIVLSVTLTSVDRNKVSAPTMSPTTQFEGIETSIELLVLASFPAAVNSLSDEASPQTEALRWISTRRLNDPPQFSETRILQQYALATFFFSTLGDSSWAQKGGWLNGTDECTWYGVECASAADGANDGVIIQLSLPENNVSGTIPSDLSILSNSLVALDLSINRLLGSIPESIGLLSLLNSISLNSNRLGGTIPSSIQNIVNLEHFDLSLNKLTGFIPSEIKRLTILRTINVDHNLLVDAIPSEIGRLTSLEYLSCEENKMSSPLPSEVGLLTVLGVLKARGNSFVGPLPSQIGSLRRLHILDLSNNLIFGSIPHQISLLTKLTSLDLSSNLLTGSVPENLGLLNLLTSLSLHDNSLMNILPASIGLAKGLLHLDVSGNILIEERPTQTATVFLEDDFRSFIPLEVAWLSNLISLDLSGLDFNSPPTSLSALTNLEVLRLSNSNFGDVKGFNWSSDSFAQFVASLASLREIDFSRSRLVGFLPTEFGLLSQLEVLDLHGNGFWGPLVTDLGLLPSLSILNLGDNNLDGSIPSEFFNLSNLRQLNLGSDGTVSSYSPGENNLSGIISTMIGQLINLRRLNLDFNQITGTIPSEIGLLELIEDLHLAGNGIIGYIPTEIELLTGLKTLDLHGTEVSGLIPANFEKLEMLDLSATLLTGSIPSGVWSMSNLRLLHLSSTMILGSIPSELGLLSRLSSFAVAGSDLAGSAIPTQIGLLSDLHSLDLIGGSLSGSIPSEVFQCTKLTTLRLGGNTYSGSLPSQLGLVTKLLELQISDAPITGEIPSEIGNLQLLTSLNLSRLDIVGSVPTELSGRLRLLEFLNLEYTKLSGDIPAHLFGLSNLKTLSFGGIDRAGSTIPSEIGFLSQLLELDLSFSNIGGTLPPEMMNMEGLLDTDIRGNDITGSFPSELCGTKIIEISSITALSMTRVAYIDCAEVSCSCCECVPTLAPSLSSSPSFSPSTMTPSSSISPSALPSLSTDPSMSMSPTRNSTCSSFSSIADIGTDIFPLQETDEGLFIVSLPFAFSWRGQVEYSLVTISPNGVIFLGDTTSSNCDENGVCNFPTFCCNPYPVGPFGNSGFVRIAVAQEDLVFPEFGSAYYATVGDTFIISFEGAEFFSHRNLEHKLNFQIVLRGNGDIEMRWGDGNIRSMSSVAGGLEDGLLAIPVTGEPFDPLGVTKPGTWPTNQCRMFISTFSGDYVEFDI